MQTLHAPDHLAVPHMRFRSGVSVWTCCYAGATSRRRNPHSNEMARFHRTKDTVCLVRMILVSRPF